MPGEMAEDQAAHERPQDRPEQPRKAHQRHHPPELAFTRGVDQQGLNEGQHQATTNTLQHPEGDQDLDIPGRAGEQRPDDEEGERAHPGLLGAEAIHGPAADWDHHPEREHVGADDPLGRRHRGAQLPGERVDGHADDRRVEHDHHRPGDENDGQLHEASVQPVPFCGLSHRATSLPPGDDLDLPTG